MNILKMDPPTRGGPEMVAEFVLQLNPDIRFCGLRLLKGESGYRVHFPKISGGGHGVTVSQELRAQITEIAKQFYEGLDIANDNRAHSG